ncbi:MAG: tetratricopeptide repeat protein [Chloroflexota bacterium]
MSRQLVPPFILDKVNSGETNGRFQAVCLFVDSSGFTPLTSALMAHGPVGAELIAQALQTIFAPLVQMVDEHGGFIAGFAGDAFKAIFPLGDEAETAVCRRVVQVAHNIRTYVLANATQTTDYGSFDLVVKGSVGLGNVSWHIWQTDTLVANGEQQQMAYTFGGDGLANCMAADAYAQAGDILLARAVQEAVPEAVVEPLTERFGRLMEIGDWRLEIGRVNLQSPISTHIASRFFPTSLLNSPDAGEFRQVVTMFVNLKPLPSAAETAVFHNLLFERLATYEGYLCRVGQIGSYDSGITLLLFWGAPRSHENDAIRALNFILDLRDELSVPLRAGISTGMAFAGFVGGTKGEEYTCYGAAVTLAARQMVSAGWGDVWLDEETARLANREFGLSLVGKRPFKGYKEVRSVFALHGRQTQVVFLPYRGQLVGREDLLAELQTAVSPVLNGRFAGIVVLQGEAGIGKSRLAHTFQSRLTQTQWAVCQTDEILRQSLNPFRYFLRRYFEQDATANDAENKTRFAQKLDSLIAATTETPLREGLERTRSFLGSLVNLYWPGSLYDELDPQLRYENTLEALKGLFKALSQQQPLVIFLEDGQWLDGDSRQFLGTLTRNVGAYPFVVFISSREPLVEADIAPHATWTTQTLGPLANEQVQTFVQTMLGETADASLIQTLARRTGGNPFFMEQMLLYWRENDWLQPTLTGLSLMQRDEALPSDVRAILIARIDSLVQSVKNVVLTASILGHEFELQLLSEMLQTDRDFASKVAQAQHAAIWFPLNELRYLFRHALLRDAAYEMQLQRRRVELHQLALTALKTLYQVELTPYYADLAHHAHGAGDAAEAIVWYRKAGSDAAKRYANEEATTAFSNGLALAAENDYAQKYDLLSEREQVYATSGQREEQRQDLAALEKLLPHFPVNEETERRKIELRLRQAQYAENMGDYEAMRTIAQEAITLAETHQDNGLAAHGYHLLGAAIWPLKNYADTVVYFEKGLSLARAAGNDSLAARIINSMGIYASKHGDLAAAADYHRQARELFRQLDNQQEYSSATNNLGLTIMKQGDYPQARVYYEEAYAAYKRFGFRHRQASLMGNLGIIDTMYGRYELALTHFQKVLAEFLEIGQRWGAATAYAHMGRTTLFLGDYAATLQHCRQGQQIFQEINHKPGEGIVVGLQGMRSLQLGDYAAAEVELQQARDLFASVSVQRNVIQGDIYLGWLARRQGNLAEAERLLTESLAALKQVGERTMMAQAQLHLGYVYWERGAWAEAEAAWTQAHELRQALGEAHLAIEPLAGLTAVLWQQNKRDAAQKNLTLILDQLDKQPANGTDETGQLCLTCYEILVGLKDGRSATLLNQAHTLLQQRAATIENEQQRTAYLTKIPAHDKICRLWQEHL